ncbi:MAG: hypothetical protein HYR51_19870, partial [Candidatus Rokubacteria bacterium]|nr:hypothetical protein [Candidatus Rokubacteria bacterium]
RLLDRPDELARWVVIVEGRDEATVERACGATLAPAALTAQGATADVSRGTYRLVLALSREELR